ncbi:ephrin-A1 isoform X1 [Lemur catta]|uniref:ephrin-A1 isoform X1 n=1 Tax=Lemur catta TaxID=9447 RepID=UPI001E2678B4|nr:ephrin-A1 isoform X1 [Lemur catta]
MEFLWAPLLGLCCSLAAADRHTVFWNSSNPKFWKEDYTVHVRLNDYLDIICPHYEDDSVAEAAMERYTLYLVEREEYQLCQPQSKDQVRWQCNQPNAKHGPEKLSEKFQRFTPFTLGKEFKEGHSYYYISKPIHHQEDQCLRLKVTVNGKISECQGPVGLPPASLCWAWSSDLGWYGSPTAQPTQHLHPSASLAQCLTYCYSCVSAHSPQPHANSQEKRLAADDPEVQVLHSIGYSAAPRLFPFAWAVLLLPLLLLQTP